METDRRGFLKNLGIGVLGIGAMSAGLPVNKAESKIIEKEVIKEVIVEKQIKTRKARVTEEHFVPSQTASGSDTRFVTVEDVEIVVK